MDTAIPTDMVVITVRHMFTATEDVIWSVTVFGPRMVGVYNPSKCVVEPSSLHKLETARMSGPFHHT
jgi:hypothetical protein